MRPSDKVAESGDHKKLPPKNSPWDRELTEEKEAPYKGLGEGRTYEAEGTECAKTSGQAPLGLRN